MVYEIGEDKNDKTNSGHCYNICHLFTTQSDSQTKKQKIDH